MVETESVSYTNDTAFHALGLDDADEMVVRADLMRAIGQIIASRALTQAQAGALMGLDQPRVSDLVQGRISRFSTDRLLRALRDLGQDVNIRVTPAAAGQEKGTIRVAS